MPLRGQQVNEIEPGMVIQYAGGTPPLGYLAIDGALISRAVYSRLWAIAAAEIAAGRSGGNWWGAGDGTTTLKIPDARGLFLRPWGPGAFDSGRVLGSLQGDATKLLMNSWSYSSSFSSGVGDGGAGIAYHKPGVEIVGIDPLLSVPNYPHKSGLSITMDSRWGQGTETRPNNLSILYCLKY